MRVVHFFAVLLFCTLMVSPVFAEKASSGAKEELTPITVNNIAFNYNDETELLCMDFSSPRIPDLETIDDAKNPRLYFDINSVSQWKGKSAYETKGIMVKQIRTGYDTKKKRLRVVMDLNAIYNYYIEYSFDERYNLYCVAISIRDIR